MIKTPIFYSPNQVADHQFISIQKLPAFIAGARRAFIEPDPFVSDDFKIAHKAIYVDDILALKVRNGFGTKSQSVNRALAYSNASLWSAAEFVLKNGGIACSASQGFHHAFYDSSCGYCTFNGLVIAARKALDLVDKILIIDGDAHYGDGTDDCLRSLELSSQVINITRDHGIGEDQAELDEAGWVNFTERLIESYRPNLVLYQAGADAWEGDPYGCGYLSYRNLRNRDRGIFSCCLKNNLPIAWNLAGGYTSPMTHTVNIHLQTLSASDSVLMAS